MCYGDRLFFFFFFQAEDGIRDKLVTGVQTCALPISPSQDLDNWSVKPRGPGQPARRARRAAGRARRRRPPMPAMGDKGGASLRGAIAHTERHPTGRQQLYELLAHG